jgi:hypothetical protein
MKITVQPHPQFHSDEVAGGRLDQPLQQLPESTSSHSSTCPSFGNDPSLALLSRNIIERAQGNPFFLGELVNALVERGDFEGEKGAYRLKGGIDSIPLDKSTAPHIPAV